MNARNVEGVDGVNTPSQTDRKYPALGPTWVAAAAAGLALNAAVAYGIYRLLQAVFS